MIEIHICTVLTLTIVLYFVFLSIHYSMHVVYFECFICISLSTLSNCVLALLGKSVKFLYKQYIKND